MMKQNKILISLKKDLEKNKKARENLLEKLEEINQKLEKMNTTILEIENQIKLEILSESSLTLEELEQILIEKIDEN